MHIFIPFHIFLFFTTFQFLGEATICDITSYNPEESIWFSYLSSKPEKCISKNDEILNVTLFVSPLENPNEYEFNTSDLGPKFENLFECFLYVMNITKSVVFSNIQIYLLGNRTHYFYNTTDMSEFLFFRRKLLNISISPLFCSDFILYGCFLNSEEKALVEIKNDRLLFFVSDSLSFKNIVILGRDIVYNYYNYFNNRTKDNQTICEENDLESENINDENLSKCYIKNKKVQFNNSQTFGFINLEYIEECSICPKPFLNIENCEFIDITSFLGGNSLVSFINIAQPFVGKVQLRKNFFNKLFFFYGLLNVKFEEGIFKKEDLSYLEINILLEDNYFKNYNFYDFEPEDFPDYLGFINFKFQNVYSFLPRINFTSFKNIISNFSLNALAENFIFFNLNTNGFSEITRFLIDNSYFFDNDFDFLISTQENTKILILEFRKSIFLNNFGFSYYIDQNHLYLNNCIFDHHVMNNSMIILNKANLTLIFSKILNVFQEKTISLIDIYDTVSVSTMFLSYMSSNLSFDFIHIDYTLFYNLSNLPIINSKKAIRELVIQDSIFETIDVSHMNTIFYCIIENRLLLNNSAFTHITSNYIFHLDTCRNRTFNNISLINSSCSFLNSFSLKIGNHSFVRIIFNDFQVKNLIFPQNIISPFINAKINYIDDCLDCMLRKCLFENISAENKVVTKRVLIYIEHCAFMLMNEIIVNEIHQLLFLHLFTYNKVNSLGYRLKAFANISNIYFHNEGFNSFGVIYLETMFYTLISNSSFQDSKNSNFYAIFSKCYPECFIIFENLLLYQTYSFQINYQNIQSFFIRNCSFLESGLLRIFLRETILNMNNPPPKFLGSQLIDLSLIKDFVFIFENFENFFDFNQTWFNDNISYGISNCTFLTSKETQILLDNKNDLFISNVVFYNIFSYFGSIYIGEFSNLFAVKIKFYDCGSFANGGTIFFDYSSKASINESFFKNISSHNNGGVFYLAPSKVKLILKGSTFLFCSSHRGGVIYGENCYLEVFQCNISNIYVLNEGGFIYSTNSSLDIHGVFFNNSISDNNGAAMSLYKSNKFNVTNSTFVNNSALNGIFYIVGDLDFNYFMGKIILLSNINYNKNAIIIIEKSKIFLNDLIFENNTSIGSFISCFSAFSIVKIELKNCVFLKNSGKNSIILVKNTDIQLRNISFKDNIIDSNLIYLESTTVFFSNIYVFLSENFLYQPKDNYIISGLLSECYFKNLFIDIQNIYGGFSCQKCKNIYLVNNTFKNCSQKKGGGISVKNSKNLIINLCVFLKNQANYAAGIYIEYTPFFAKDSVFVENSANIKTSDVNIAMKKMENGSSYLINCSFLRYIQTSLNFEDIPNLIMYNCYFIKKEIENIAPNIELNFININEITIISTEFYSTSLSLVSNSLSLASFLLFNSTFHACSSLFYGGAININGLYSCNISNSQFINNTALLNGGAINFECWSQTCSLCLLNNTFLNNKAKFLGGAIKIEFLINVTIVFQTNYFQWNSAKYGNDLSSGPNEIILTTNKIFPENLISLTNISIKSGIPTKFYAYIVDQMKNYLITQTTGNFTFFIDGETNVDLQNCMASESQGLGVFENLIIFGQPGKNFSLFLSYKKNEYILQNEFFIQILPCVKGEFFFNLQCLSCSTLLFSLDSDPVKQNKTSCEICPSNAICPGRDLIIPKEGFWRYDDNTKFIVACTSYENCIDQTPYYLINGSGENLEYNFNKKFSFVCGEGSYGNLCTNCFDGYGKDSTKKCSECVFAKYFTMALLSLFFLLYQTNVAIKISPRDSKQRSLIKLLINHNYYLSSVVMLPNEFTQTFLYIYGFINQYLTAIPEDFNNLDCFIGYFLESNDVFKIKLIVYSFFPFIISLFLIILRLLLFILKIIFQSKRGKLNIFFDIKSKFLNEFIFSLVASVIVTIYSFYSRILNNNLSLLKCIQINDNEEEVYLEVNPNILCWTKENDHLEIIYALFIPNFIFWCIGFPVALFIFLKYYKSSSECIRETLSYQNFQSFYLKLNFRKKDNSPRNNNRRAEKTNKANISQAKFICEFMTIDYKHEFYYWECFFYLTMLVITSTNILSHKIGFIPQITILIFVFYLILVITLKFQPFRYKSINNIACFSYIIVILTLSLSLMASAENINYPIQKLVFYGIVIFLNAVFFLKVFLNFMISFLRKDFKVFGKTFALGDIFKPSSPKKSGTKKY